MTELFLLLLSYLTMLSLMEEKNYLSSRHQRGRFDPKLTAYDLLLHTTRTMHTDTPAEIALQFLRIHEQELAASSTATADKVAARIYRAASTSLGRVRKLYIAKGVLPPSAADPTALGGSQRGKTLVEVFAAMPPIPWGDAE